MVEVITLRACWQDGRPVPAGTVCSLSETDAAYGESLGRVERITPERLLNEALASSAPIKRGRGRPRKNP